MFLRKTERRKNGKTHLYWSVVENRRLGDGRVAQRHVLYLGEINSSQAEAWRRAIEVFDEEEGNCSAPSRVNHAARGIDCPSSVSLIASMARTDRLRAVSTTDRMSA